MKKTYLLILILIGLIINFKEQPAYAQKSSVKCPPELEDSDIRKWWKYIAYYKNRNAMITARSYYFTANKNNWFVDKLLQENDPKTVAFIFYQVAEIMDGLYRNPNKSKYLYNSSANLSTPTNTQEINQRIIKADAKEAWQLFINTYKEIPSQEKSYVCPAYKTDKLSYARKRLQELSR